MEMKKILLAVALMLGMAAGSVQVRAGKLATGLGIVGAVGVLASYLPIYECENHGGAGSEVKDIKLRALREILENYKNSGRTVTLSNFKVKVGQKWQDKSYADCANMPDDTSTSYKLSQNWASTTISPWCGRLFWGGLGAMAFAVGLSI